MYHLFSPVNLLHPTYLPNLNISHLDSIEYLQMIRRNHSRSKHQPHPQSKHSSQRSQKSQARKILNTRPLKLDSPPLTQPRSPRQSRNILEVKTRLLPKTNLRVRNQLVEVLSTQLRHDPNQYLIPNPTQQHQKRKRKRKQRKRERGNSPQS